MIIWRIRPLANDRLDDSAICEWSSRRSGLLQMIIRRIWPLANDHPEDLASCKWSSGGTGLLQMIICHPRRPNYLSQDLNSISRTFLEQFALVSIISFNCRLDLSIKQSFCFLSILKMAGTLIKMEYPVTVWYIVWVAYNSQLRCRSVPNQQERRAVVPGRWALYQA